MEIKINFIDSKLLPFDVEGLQINNATILCQSNWKKSDYKLCGSPHQTATYHQSNLFYSRGAFDKMPLNRNIILVTWCYILVKLYGILTYMCIWNPVSSINRYFLISTFFLWNWLMTNKILRALLIISASLFTISTRHQRKTAPKGSVIITYLSNLEYI